MTWRPVVLPPSLRPMRRRVALSPSFGGEAVRRSLPRPRMLRIGNVAPPEEPEAPVDETGLVMRHELSPGASAQLQKIGDQIASARKYGPWIAAGVGIVAGAIAAAVWWNASSADKGQRRKARPRR